MGLNKLGLMVVTGFFFTLKQTKAWIIIIIIIYVFTEYNLNVTRCFHFGLTVVSHISADVYSVLKAEDKF